MRLRSRGDVIPALDPDPDSHFQFFSILDPDSHPEKRWIAAPTTLRCYVMIRVPCQIIQWSLFQKPKGSNFLKKCEIGDWIRSPVLHFLAKVSLQNSSLVTDSVSSPLSIPDPYSDLSNRWIVTSLLTSDSFNVAKTRECEERKKGLSGGTDTRTV